MNAGLLFYLARKTSQCQKTVSRYIGYYDLTVSEIKICARAEHLRASMSRLIAAYPITVIVSGSFQNQPEVAAPLFHTLKIPLDSSGEPRGVLRLAGEEHTGYLIESINQAIVVLLDIPHEILRMLPAACERLNVKFALNGEVPQEPKMNYGELVEKSYGAK